MLYSIGKDSSAMLHIALKAFAPGKPPFPLLHIDTTWKFREMIAFRDETVARAGLDLLVHINEEGLRRGISPIASRSVLHTQVMKTDSLRLALDYRKFDLAFGGARRDEEKSRAKERIFSHRTVTHAWDPRNQRPELWQLFNAYACGGCRPRRKSMPSLSIIGPVMQLFEAYLAAATAVRSRRAAPAERGILQA